MRSKWLVGLVGAVLVGVAALASGASAPAKAAPPKEPWPAFTMVYEDRSVLDGNAITKTYRLDYRSQKNWRIEVLGNSGSPADVGSWAEYSSDTVKSFDAVRNLSGEKAAPKDGIHVVDEWLIPGRAGQLQNMAEWSTSNAGNGPLTMVKVESKSCQADQACPSGHHTVRDVRTFEPGFDIPTSVRLEVDGKLMREITVSKLEISE